VVGAMTSMNRRWWPLLRRVGAAADCLPERETRLILYVTATYGFRHADSIDASLSVFR